MELTRLAFMGLIGFDIRLHRDRAMLDQAASTLLSMYSDNDMSSVTVLIIYPCYSCGIDIYLKHVWHRY